MEIEPSFWIHQGLRSNEALAIQLLFLMWKDPPGRCSKVWETSSKRTEPRPTPQIWSVASFSSNFAIKRSWRVLPARATAATRSKAIVSCHQVNNNGAYHRVSLNHSFILFHLLDISHPHAFLTSVVNDVSADGRGRSNQRNARGLLFLKTVEPRRIYYVHRQNALLTLPSFVKPRLGETSSRSLQQKNNLK